jgi:hypothetical protein
MSLTDLASIGSLASGIAVLFSLLFVGVQIRQSNRNQRSLMQQGRSARNVELLLRLTEPRLSGIMARILAGDDVTDEEFISYYGFAAAVFWSYEDSFLQLNDGMLDPKAWDSDVLTLRGLLSNPAYRAVWRTVRDSIGGDYKAFIDQVAAEARKSAPRRAPTTLRQYFSEEVAAQGSSSDSPN